MYSLLNSTSYPPSNVPSYCTSPPIRVGLPIAHVLSNAVLFLVQNLQFRGMTTHILRASTHYRLLVTCRSKTFGDIRYISSNPKQDSITLTKLLKTHPKTLLM